VEGKEVFFISGDLGGYEDTLPVVRRLQKSGARIRYFVDPDGVAKKRLDEVGTFCEFRLPQEKDEPDLIIIGVSSSAFGLQVAWTEFGWWKGIPVFWIEDVPGMAAAPHVRVELERTRVSPRVIFCSEVAGEGINRKYYPGARVLCLGKTTFEGLGELRKKAKHIRSLVRARAKIKEQDKVIAFWSGGSSKDRVEEQLGAIVSVLAKMTSFFDGRFSFAPLFHPQLDRNFYAGTTHYLFGKAMGLCESAGIEVIDLRGKNPADNIMASDITIGDWDGNEATRSTVLGVPAIITLFPDDFERRVDLGFKHGAVSLISSGAAFGVKNAGELDAAITHITNNEKDVMDALREASKPYFSMGEPGATARIVFEILEWMGIR